MGGRRDEGYEFVQGRGGGGLARFKLIAFGDQFGDVRGWIGGGEGEGKGGVYIQLSYEAKNKRQKLRCLLLRRKKKNIFYLFMK